MNRRNFIKQASFSVVGTSLLPIVRSIHRFDVTSSGGPEGIIERLLSEAISHGAGYADVRYVNLRRQTLQIQNLIVSNVFDGENEGFALRVHSEGSYGFAATDQLSTDTLSRFVGQAMANARERSRVVAEAISPVKTDARANWQSPCVMDPFEVSLPEKIDFLKSLTGSAIDKSGIEFAVANLFLEKREQLFMSTGGARIEQKTIYTYPNFAVTAVAKKQGIMESRSSTFEPKATGYEITRQYAFADEVLMAVEDAREMLTAPTVSVGPADLVIDPAHLWHVLDETIGYHLDPDNLFLLSDNNPREVLIPVSGTGGFRIGSDAVTIHADNTLEGGLATAPFDDEGNPSSRYTLIERGRVSGLPSTTENVSRSPLMSAPSAAFAENWNGPVRLRMPNLVLQAGSSDLTIQRLISSVEKGLLIRGRGTVIHNYDRQAFLVYPPRAWRIENGALNGMAGKISYQARMVDFWNACTAVGTGEESFMGGNLWTSKGDPPQRSPYSVIVPPALFRSVQVLPTSQ